MNYWVTSDLHLGHANIIKYCNRPFGSLEEMNEKIIKRWNERIKPDDTVYHLGDFCFKSAIDKGNGMPIKPMDWLKQLNGNIMLIKGNHEGNNGIKTNIQSIKIKYAKYIINMCHRPQDISYNCDFNLVGHVHDKWKSNVTELPQKDYRKIVSINVGVDVWHFYPISLNEIVRYYERIIAGEAE